MTSPSRSSLLVPDDPQCVRPPSTGRGRAAPPPDNPSSSRPTTTTPTTTPNPGQLVLAVEVDRRNNARDALGWIRAHGRVSWERELNRQRKARNERTRARTAAIVAARRGAA